MKKILTITIASLLSFSAIAAKFEQGKHYEELTDAAFNAPNQIVKIYSTNCPFCYKYEKAVIPSYIKNLPDNVSYDAYHITTKPPFGKEKATVIAVAKQLGEQQYQSVKMAYYSQIHDKKIKFKSADKTIEFGLDKLGITKNEFEKLKNKPEVTKLLTKWDQGVKVAKIKGIPAIVINGKYLINTKSITSMKMLDELTAELLNK